MKFTVAIDGPAAAGKGTVSRALAEHFGFAHLDTGLLYRATGAKALDAGGTDSDQALYAAQSLTAADLARADLRSATTGEAASVVAALPAVRTALMEWQRDFARRDGGAVLDGRDIGTVICPDAEVKLFITASPETRASRRFEEFKSEGITLSYETVLDQVRARDARDAGRKDAPMIAAEDAHLLDTTNMSIERAVAEAVRLVENRLVRG
jgi:cytidylate kinase